MRKQVEETDPAGIVGDRGGQKELETLVFSAGLCTGCGACVNLCPYQASYRDRTVILHSCDLVQGRCYAFCPGTPADLNGLYRTLCEERDLTPELGAVKGFFITRAADEGIRSQAQHGGTVTALMALALQEGLIDAAILAKEGEDLLPRSVTIRDPQAVAGMGKSRFIVSPTVAEFNRTLRGGDAAKIGVVVTPCQALSLAKMRVAPSPVAEAGMDRLKLVLGLFCGWALSWRGFFDLLHQKTEIALLTGMDIPPSRYHTLEVYTKRGTIGISLDEVTPCVREACRSCSDMTAEFSDLSVGSARLPEGWPTARHWNQVIVRTERGQELLELAKRIGVLEFREVPEGNLGKLKAASLNKKRAAASHSGRKAKHERG